MSIIAFKSVLLKIYPNVETFRLSVCGLMRSPHTHASTHARTHARTHAHTHARTHAHARTHTHAHTHTHRLTKIHALMSIQTLTTCLNALTLRFQTNVAFVHWFTRDDVENGDEENHNGRHPQCNCPTEPA